MHNEKNPTVRVMTRTAGYVCNGTYLNPKNSGKPKTTMIVHNA
jgi:hypothetical protein